MLWYFCANIYTQVIHSRNFLDWITDLDNKWKITTLSTQFMYIAIANDRLVKQVMELADREVESTPSSAFFCMSYIKSKRNSAKQTLFRGNTIFTKTVELCMAFYGKHFLELSIGPVLRRLCAEKVAIEVDPVRSAGKSAKEIEKNVDLLKYWCTEFWKQIWSVRAECPKYVKRFFKPLISLTKNSTARCV